MRYTPRHTFWMPIILGLLSILWPILFFNGSLNGKAFAIFEICSLVFFFFSISQNFIFLEIKDRLLLLKRYGIKQWSVSLDDIAMIDDVQNKSYKPDFGTVIIGGRGGNVVGFVLKTVSNQVLVMPTAIQNYDQFLTDLKSINPNIQVTKLTEALNQPLIDKMNKPLW